MKILATAVAGLLCCACTQGSGSLPQLLLNQSGNLPSPGGNPVGTSSPSASSSLQKMIYRIGPVDLPAHALAEEMIEKPLTLPFQVTEPVWLVGFEPKLSDNDGNPLPTHLLHKALIFNKHEANPMCVTGNGGNPFAVATSTMSRVELPEGHGYALLPEDSLEARVILRNPTEENFYGVNFYFELTAIPMEKANGLIDVQPLLLDLDPCDHKPIGLAPGAFDEKNKTFSVPAEGRLIVADGALCDVGVSVSLTKEKEILPFWRAFAKWDDSKSQVKLEPNPFIDPAGKEFKAGEKITLGVTFDNFSDKWQQEATGAAMLYLARPQD